MIIKHHTNGVKSWQVRQLKDAVQGKSSLVRSWGSSLVPHFLTFTKLF